MLGRNLAAVAECGRVAARQAGAVSRKQAKGAGLSSDAIDRLVAEGAWARVRPAVYVLWTPDGALNRWRQRLTATGLWLGDKAAVSHFAACILHEVDGVKSAPLEFSTTGRRRTEEPGLVIHRVGSLPPTDIMFLDGVRVTTPVRTVIDVAGRLEPNPLEAVIESVLRTRKATIEQIRQANERSAQTTPGRGLLLEVLRDLPSIRTESHLETLTWQYFRLEGMPMPQRQYRVRDERGKVVARPDFAFVNARLAVEALGHASHSLPRDWKRDRRRENVLLRLGWELYRVIWDDVETAEAGRRMAADVAAIVQSRIAKLPIPNAPRKFAQ